MEKSEVIQKRLQGRYRLISITHFTSDWYHFYLFLMCIDFTAKYKINNIINFTYDDTLLIRLCNL